MTYIWAGITILLYPLALILLKNNILRRSWAFIVLGVLSLAPNIPTGYLYGWFGWPGIVKGFGVPIVVVLSLALISTRRGMTSRSPFWWLFALYGAALLISIFPSRVGLATVFVWWQYASLLLVFAAVAGEADKPVIRSAILTGFSIGLSYQALYSISQQLSGVTQAKGTFVHQNVLGLATELILIPLIAIALGGVRTRTTYVGLISGLICVAGSGSRATMGIVGGGIILLGMLSLARNANPRKIAAAFLGVAILAVTTLFALGTLNERFQGENFFTGDDQRVRFEEAARAIADDNFFGVGANNYVLVSNTEGYADEMGVGWQRGNRAAPVHNAYLVARAEAGRLGEIAFFLILAVPIYFALRLSFKHRTSLRGDLLLGCAVALIANILHNMYEYAAHTFAIQVLIMIIIGFVAAEVRNEKTRASQLVKRRRQSMVGSG